MHKPRRTDLRGAHTGAAPPIRAAHHQKQQQRKGPNVYIDVDAIIKLGSLLGALIALVSAIIAVYKVYETNKKQSVVIKEIQEEQTLICYGLRGALQGLIEQGCDGPCKDALNMLDKHLNKSAHNPDL